MSINRRKMGRVRRCAFTLLELLAVVTILGIIAVVVVPRITLSSATAKAKADLHNRAVINSAIERYYVEIGSWPSTDMSEIDTGGAEYLNYFPEGLPSNPVDASAYTMDATTHRVD